MRACRPGTVSRNDCQRSPPRLTPLFARRCCGASTCRARATPPTRRPTASSRPSAPADYRQALAQRAQRRRRRRRVAAVALRAHPVLRIAVLLLRLQQDHHQAPRAGGRVPDATWRARSTCTPRSSARGQPVTQLHLGGGTPTFLSRRRTARADGHAARAASRWRRAPRYSIEVDPRTVDAGAAGSTWPSSASTA